MVSGLIIGGFGFGAFFFGFISFAQVNPNNANPDLKVDGGVIFSPDRPEASKFPEMLRVNIIIWSVLVLIGLVCVNRKDKVKVHSSQRQGFNPNMTEELETFLTSNPNVTNQESSGTVIP